MVSGKTLVLVAALLCATAAWLFRYDVQPVSAPPAGVYIVDRWTGEIRFVQDRKIITSRPFQ